MSATSTGRSTRTIPLDIRPPNFSFIQFLRAEVNATTYTPFALIRYAIRGNERSKALRLDLDKRAFIDPGDAEQSESDDFAAAAEAVASVIAEKIARETFRWFASEH
jgi:hypothetical protein